MKIERTDWSVTEFAGNAIVIGVNEQRELGHWAKQVDDASQGRLSERLERRDVSTQLGTVTLLYDLPQIAAPVLAVVGLGREPSGPALAARAAGAAAKTLASQPRQSVGFFLDDLPAEPAIVGAMRGCVGQDLYKQPPALHPIDTISWPAIKSEEIAAAQAIGECVNLTRRLVNLPPNELYPESFAEQCLSLGRELDFEVEVWDEQRLAQENCNAHLAVGQASAKPPRTVIMRHMKGGPDGLTLGWVGKGVTFDSGGLSLKPSESMLDMKCDMAGAAAVLGAICAIAKMNLPVNVVGLVGLAENLISGNSYKLGDVIKARNGTTVEIHNTDAEGRLVLADTLDIAINQNVDALVDLATLTGACMVALGRDVAGLMTNDDEFCKQLIDCAVQAGELVWQLPMFPEYNELIRGKVADIKNVGEGRWGGAITAAKFLEQFVGQTPWTHIDIAGPSFLDKPKPWLDAGGSGCLVPTLVQLARKQTR